ncbi:hypothetical protein ACP275_09G041400 [Erythranthe tilingii]
MEFDLNVVTTYFVDDPNVDLNSLENATFSMDRSLLDLNKEPFVEHDISLEMGLQTFMDDNLEDVFNIERRAIYNVLQHKSINGSLKKGVTKIVASQFSVSIQTVQRIWRQSRKGAHDDVSHKKTRNCGRKRIEINMDQFRGIPLHRRTTLESLACSLNMAKITLFRQENKRSRLEFWLSMLEGNSIHHDPIFRGMYNIIHIDEKWFQLTKKSEHYYLLPEEEDPIRTFAIARPKFDEQGNEIFSGKIGVFSLVTREPAKRNSVNRVAGTLETKPIASVKRDVIPTIKEKWPREDSRYPIFIQQDNARTHIPQDDIEFCQVEKEDGFDIRLMCQPPNSPELNVLDLGFFNAIQSLQYKETPQNVDELINAVVRAFEGFSARKSNRIFLTLQSCMIEIMRGKGSNKFKIPHMSKAMLEREGRLPTQLKCDRELVQEILNYLG